MDPVRVPRFENRVPKVRENYHRVPSIREIGALQVDTGHLSFSLKNPAPGVHLPFRRGTFKVSHRREIYIYISFISKILYIYQ